MKICVSAVAGSLDARVDPRFGRCAYYVIVDSGTMQFEAVLNTASGAMGGAGIQAAQNIVNRKVDVLITGNVGPNAFQVLSAAGIKVVPNAFGTVTEVVERYKKGELEETKGPTVRGHFGAGAGRGRGWRGDRWED
jgi:predicted Fe-Mo cluster-binding NifX family protein